MRTQGQHTAGAISPHDNNGASSCFARQSSHIDNGAGRCRVVCVCAPRIIISVSITIARGQENSDETQSFVMHIER